MQRLTNPRVAYGFKCRDYDCSAKEARNQVRPHLWLTTCRSGGGTPSPSARFGISLPPTDSGRAIQPSQTVRRNTRHHGEAVQPATTGPPPPRE